MSREAGKIRLEKDEKRYYNERGRNMNELKISDFEEKSTNDTAVFDDVFRTMLERIPEVMIPLINEVFGTHYSEDETIMQLKNEHYTKGGAIITDCVLNICGKQYHLECQSNPDNTIALRMIEYDMAIALHGAKEVKLTDGAEHDYELTFPNSCVLYLRDNRKTKDKANVRIMFQDGSSHVYSVPIVKVQSYTKEEIFEKKLLAFVPYYMMRYEGRLSEICENKEKAELLQKEYLELRVKLEKIVGEEEGLLYVELISHMNKIADYIFKEEPEMRERMEAIVMGGQVYETITDQLLARGRDEGRDEGRAEGRSDGIFLSVGRLAATGQYTEQAACEVLGAEYEEYLKFKERLCMEKEQKSEQQYQTEQSEKAIPKRTGLRR